MWQPINTRPNQRDGLKYAHYYCTNAGRGIGGRAGLARPGQAGVSRDLNRARVFVDVASGRGKVNRRSERRRCCTRTRSELLFLFVRFFFLKGKKKLWREIHQQACFV